MSRNVEEVLPGLYKLALPVPIPSLKLVFAYLARDGDENLLIDTGWSSEESFDALNSAFSWLNIEPEEIQRIVVSHLHPDHFGQSVRLKKISPRCTIMMHKEDAANLRNTPEEYQQFLDSLNEWLGANGAPDSLLNESLGSNSPLSEYVNPGRPDLVLMGGERIRVGKKFDFEVIWTPGHTRGNICLFDRGKSRALFSGDHILPTITPNVSLSPMYPGNPLGDYLDSLEKVRKLNEWKVLPSHEFVFENLGKRLLEIKLHHRERLDDTENALSGFPQGRASGYEVASKLHWYSGSWEKLSSWEKRAALMETLAHLEYLHKKKKIGKTRKKSIVTAMERTIVRYSAKQS